MADVCTKCGLEPRSGKNRWGSRCIAASRKSSGKRANGGGTNGANETNAQTVLPCAECEVRAQGIESLRRALAELEGRNAVLREDNERLKKELAKRGRAEVPVREMAVAARGMGKREGHGQFCAGVCCR